MPMLLKVTLTLVALGGLALTVSSPVAAQGKKTYPLPAQSTIADVAVGGLTIEEALNRTEQLWRAYVDTPWTLTIGDTPHKVAPSTWGLQVDRPALRTALLAAQQPPQNAWEQIRAWFVAPPAITLPLSVTIEQADYDVWIRTMRPVIERPPVEARLDWATKTVLPESTGIAFDKGTWQGLLDDPLPALKPRTLTLPVTTIAPQTSSATLGRVSLTEPFATFTTSFDVKKVSRSHNIQQAVMKWEGLVIPPRGEVSFNGVVGKRTAANGYKKAPVYENRRVSEGLGGGICQVSTTLYNTALLAGFDILSRGGHSRPCTYAPAGRDATVDWPNRDLKVRNPWEFPLYVHAEVDGGTVTFSFFGDLNHKPAITLEEQVTGLGGPGDPVMILDESLPAGTKKWEDKGFNGRKTVVTRIWNAGTPEERREVISTDRLSALKGILRYHPGATATAPIIEPEPTGDTDPPMTTF